MEEQVPAAPTISFGEIVTNVFTSPSDAYEGLRTSPVRASVWLVPLIVVFILTCAYTTVMFTNETIKNQVIDLQRARMQEQVQAGKMPQERADQITEGMEKGSGMMMAFGIIGAAVTITIVFFLTALLLWLVGKLVLKAEGGYGKFLELWGSTQWIGALGSVVTTLMMIGLGSMFATPSGALAVLSSFNPKDTTHRLLASVNIFSIWQFVVVGIGLGKFSGKSSGTGIAVALIVWVAWTLIVVFGLAGIGM